MSPDKYSGMSTDGSLKPYHQNRYQAAAAFDAVVTKLGVPNALGAKAGGTKAELHETRKAVIRAVNRHSEELAKPGRQFTDEDAGFQDHAASTLEQIGDMLEHLDGWERDARRGPANAWRDDKGRPLMQLRSASDFDDHYLRGKQADMTLADFMRGVANLPTTADVRNALSTGTDTAGGFAVPHIVMPQILQALAPNSALMQAGMPIVPLQEGGKDFTTVVMNGIPTAAWRAESGNVAESDPSFSANVATPRSLAFYFKISRELLADASNVQPALMTAIGQAFAKALDYAGLIGSGTAPEPRGLANVTGVHAVPYETDGWPMVDWRDVRAGMSMILGADAPKPTAAIMATRSAVQLDDFTDSTGQPLQRTPMLRDLQIIHTSQLPTDLTIGASSDCSEIYLGDFTQMAMMMRESVSVQVLNEAFATTGQIGFVCHVRADFAVFYPQAFARIRGVRPVA